VRQQRDARVLQALTRFRLGRPTEPWQKSEHVMRQALDALPETPYTRAEITLLLAALEHALESMCVLSARLEAAYHELPDTEEKREPWQSSSK
jgi:hypothetical protein